MIINTRNIPYLLIFILFLSAESKAAECTVDTFLGFHSGLKYVYQCSDGSRIEITRISTDKNKSIGVEEIIFFPESSLPPDMPKCTSIGYKLYIHGNKLIKESIKGRETILQEPLTRGSNFWKIKGMSGRKTDQREAKWKDIESLCKIVETGKSNCFGKERCTITTECVTSNNLSTIIRLETYAECIGLIERIINTKTKNGKIAEIYNLSLDRITKIQ